MNKLLFYNILTICTLCLGSGLTAQNGGIFGGRQVLKTGVKTYETLTAARTVNTKNYTITASFRHENGETQKGYGIVFESAGIENSNVFLISASGYFLTGCFSGGLFTNFCNWRKSEFINGSGGCDTLKIVKADRMTFFYVNGHQVFSTAEVKTYGSLHGYAVKKNQEVSSDFFIIETEDDKYVFESPKTLLESVNSLASEIAPIESDDGSTLYFSRIGFPGNYGHENGDIWAAQKISGGFSLPVRLPYKPNDSLVNAVIRASDGNRTLYVEGVYDKNGKRVSAHGISKTTRISDHYYSPPEEVKIKDYSNLDEHGTYAFSADFKVLIISAETKNGLGGLDLYVSFLGKDGVYSKPKNLGKPLNTELDDGTPFLTSDDKTLFFSSYGHKGFGGSDIFVSRRLDKTFLKWSEPENLGSSVNSVNWDAYFSVSQDQKTAYFVSNDNENLDEDIFSIRVPKELVCPEYVPVEPAVPVKPAKPRTDTVQYSDKFTLKHLIFEYRSHLLAPSSDADKEITELVKYLKANPKIKIKVTGHTEKGSSESLLTLSKRRAITVRELLVQKGIERERIQIDFKGGKLPVSNDKPYKNRRVEIEILK